LHSLRKEDQDYLNGWFVWLSSLLRR
jgi:hypothetical protein